MSDDSVVDSTFRDDAARREAAEIRPLRARNAELELEVLKVRDWAAAQGAHLGDLRHQLEVARLHDTNHRAHIARLEAALADALKGGRRADRLRREVEEMRASATWRVGRIVLTPVRALKRLTRRG